MNEIRYVRLIEKDLLALRLAFVLLSDEVHRKIRVDR